MRARAPADQPSCWRKRLALLVAEALDPAVLGDADLLHEAAGLDLAHAGEGLEEGDHLEPTDGVLRVGPVEGLVQGQRAHLELLLGHGEGLTGLGRLLQRCFALFGAEGRGRSHADSP